MKAGDLSMDNVYEKEDEKKRLRETEAISAARYGHSTTF